MMAERPNQPRVEHMLGIQPLNSGVADIVENFVMDPTARAVLVAPAQDTATDPRAELITSFQNSWRSLRTSNLRVSLLSTLIHAQTVHTEDPDTQQIQEATRVLLSSVPMDKKIRGEGKDVGQTDARVREEAANIYSDIVEALLEEVSPQVRNNLIETGSILVKSYPTQGRAISAGERRLGLTLFRFARVDSARTTFQEQQELTGEQSALVTQHKLASSEDPCQSLDDIVVVIAEGRTPAQVANILEVDRRIVKRTMIRLTEEGRIEGKPPDDFANRRRIVNQLFDLGMRLGLISDITGFDVIDLSNDKERYKVLREETWQPNERTQRFVEGILNNPVKIFVAIELVRRKGNPPTAWDLDRLFERLQRGQDDPYIMAEGQPRNFVQNSLIPFGFAESLPRTDTQGITFIPSEEAEGGLALYGHMLALSEQIVALNPANSLDDYLSTSNTPLDRRSPSINIRLFSELVKLRRARALPMRTVDLENITEHPTRLGERLELLGESGILTYTSSDADAPLEAPFKKLEKSAISLTPRQRRVLDNLVGILQKFEEPDNAFVQEGLGLVEAIMRSPGRIVNILRPLNKRRVVGPDVYDSRILKVFDEAEANLTVRDVSREVGLKFPYARHLIRGLTERHELVQIGFRTAKYYRRATEGERAAEAARLAAEAEGSDQA